MVFPSPGCLTCRSRRIKCDINRPVCNRCIKASRSCSWESDHETKLPFKSENSFAQGQPRRPRKQLDDRIHREPGSGLDSVEIEAFQYWVTNFTEWPDELKELGEEYVAASSLAIFGQATRTSNALRKADEFYARSILKIQEELVNLSSVTVDELLAATALLANYDGTTYPGKRNVTRNSLSTPADERHLKGTAALLQTRQMRGYPQNLILERTVRRILIRIYLLRGLSFEPWIKDGAIYGESVPVLALDSLMVQTTALRSEAVNLFINEESVQSHAVERLQNWSRKLDHNFESWSQALPENWRNVIESGTLWEMELAESGHYFWTAPPNSYSLERAAICTRYYATRLIVDSIRLKFSSTCSSLADKTSDSEAELKECSENIRAHATGLCGTASLLLYADQNQSRRIGSGSSSTKDWLGTNDSLIYPNIATLLAWPLMVAVSIESVPPGQKQWLQRKLKTIAMVLGLEILHSSADDQKEFNF